MSPTARFGDNIKKHLTENVDEGVNKTGVGVR